MPKRPKAPKPPKVPRPKVKDLRMVYKGLMTVSLQNRIASLAYALQWYDGVIPYLIQKGKLTSDAQKKLTVAVKCRKQAMGTNNDNEKEAAMLMAIRAYEKACASMKPCEVDKFYKKFQSRKGTLENRQKRMEQKFGFVVALLQKSIGERVKLQVADAQKARQYDPALTSLSYNREAAKQLASKFRDEGLLAVFVSELEFLSQHAALQRNANGEYEYDPARQLEITNELLKEFVKFAKSSDAPKRLIRTGAPKPQSVVSTHGVSTTSTTPHQKSHRGPIKGPRVGGFLVPGTAIALVYDRLKDEQEHPIADVIAGLTTADPVGRIKQLGRYGTQKGTWTVTVNGDKAQLVHTAASATP